MPQTALGMGSWQLPTSHINPNDPWGSYNAAHDASRNADQARIGLISSGYDRVLANQQADLAGVTQYGKNMQRRTIGGLKNANQANITDINKQFQKQLGDTNQEAIGSGLGNSTIMARIKEGFTQGRADSTTRSQNDFAGTIANYRTQWGMANMNQQQQSALANSGLAQQQLQWMNSINVGYPDAGAYAAAAAGHMGGGMGMGMGMPGPMLGYTPIPHMFAGGGATSVPGGGGYGDSGWSSGYSAPSGGWNPGMVSPYASGSSLGDLFSGAGGAIAQGAAGAGQSYAPWNW